MSSKEGITLSGPVEIEFGRFASLKGALKMEAKGLKTRGGPLRPKLAAEFGLKPRDDHQKYIDYCLKKMTEAYVAKNGVQPEPAFK